MQDYDKLERDDNNAPTYAELSYHRASIGFDNQNWTQITLGICDLSSAREGVLTKLALR